MGRKEYVELTIRDHIPSAGVLWFTTIKKLPLVGENLIVDFERTQTTIWAVCVHAFGVLAEIGSFFFKEIVRGVL